MTVNISTGETVPLHYPAVAGFRLHRGTNGNIYGVIANRSGPNLNTSIIRLDTSNPARSERLVEYQGEDSAFVMAESGGNLAFTLGRREAALYRSTQPGEIISLERCIGLPVKILDGGRHFIVLDGEGGLSWHDNNTGELLAVFRLYRDSWVMVRRALLTPETEIVRGRIVTN